MQILTSERLWLAKRWMSWRTFWEYLNATLWWLEGIATVVAFAVPIAVLASGAETSTAAPETASAFVAMFAVRLWGARRLVRHQIHWPTAFALRVLRVPVGMACLWWLISRRTLHFEVTPKGGADDRHRGQPPRILITLATIDLAVLAYAAAGLAHWAPWHVAASQRSRPSSSTGSRVSSSTPPSVTPRSASRPAHCPRLGTSKSGSPARPPSRWRWSPRATGRPVARSALCGWPATTGPRCARCRCGSFTHPPTRRTSPHTSRPSPAPLPYDETLGYFVSQSVTVSASVECQHASSEIVAK